MTREELIRQRNMVVEANNSGQTCKQFLVVCWFLQQILLKLDPLETHQEELERKVEEQIKG